MHSKDDSSDVTGAPSRPASPGQMLRAAREAKGLHLAMLSVALKVPTRQLEALENDQHDVFKGTIFVRALAQAVCRQLGLDPAPVLAGLPKTVPPLSVAPSASSTVVSSGASRWGRAGPLGQGMARWVLWLAVLMLVVAASLIWWPPSQEEAPAGRVPAEPASLELPPATEPEAQASEAVQATAVPAVPAAPAPAAPDKPMATVAAPAAPAAPTTPVASAAPQPAEQATPPANAAPLLIRATADVWVSVRDSRGQIVLNRKLRSGESVKLDMSPPLFVYAGRADGIELMWRGQGVDLQPHIQNNEIRLFIKP